jgi:hypothetical protein
LRFEPTKAGHQKPTNMPSCCRCSNTTCASMPHTM